MGVNNAATSQWIEPPGSGAVVPKRRVFLAYDPDTDVFSLSYTFTGPAFVETSPGVYEPQAEPAEGATVARMVEVAGVVTMY